MRVCVYGVCFDRMRCCGSRGCRSLRVYVKSQGVRAEGRQAGGRYGGGGVEKEARRRVGRKMVDWSGSCGLAALAGNTALVYVTGRAAACIRSVGSIHICQNQPQPTSWESVQVNERQEDEPILLEISRSISMSLFAGNSRTWANTRVVKACQPGNRYSAERCPSPAN